MGLFMSLKLSDNYIVAPAYYYPEHGVSKRIKYIRKIAFSDITSFHVDAFSGKKTLFAFSLQLEIKSIKQPVYISLMGYTKKQVSQIAKMLHDKTSDDKSTTSEVPIEKASL